MGRFIERFRDFIEGLIAVEQHTSRVARQCGENENALPPLRYTESEGIDSAISPTISKALKSSEYFGHILPTVQMSPVGHVLNQDVLEGAAPKQFDCFAD
jgi:hypothetical protein